MSDKYDDIPPVPSEQVDTKPARYVYPPDVQEAIARYERHLSAINAAMDAKPREAPND